MQNETRVALNQLVHVLQTCLVLLRTLIDKDTTQNGIPTILEDLKNKNCPVEQCIRNLICLNSWIFVCVEREGEFRLHLYFCKETIPYFFAGGHWNYAGDSIVNLRMSVSVLLFSNFNKISWLLTKL